MDRDRVEHVLATEIHPRLEEEARWHLRHAMQLGWARFYNIGTFFFLGMYIADDGAWKWVWMYAAVALLAANWINLRVHERRLKRHTCFDPAQYLEMARKSGRLGF